MTLLPARIEAQAKLRPYDIAVECGDRRIAYGEMNAIAGRLSGRLRSCGVGSGDVVAVLAERSALLPVALLGVWKAGAAYLPLDPAYPAGRLQFMLRDSGAKALVTERALAARVPPCDLPVFIVEDDEENGEAEEADLPDVDCTASSLAYLIYTSGSTGQPKGVEVPHGGIANSLDWVTGEMRIGASDVFLNVLTPCFDMSVFSLFLPLSNGARLVMATVEDSRNARRIQTLLASRRVTVMKATPVTWSMLIEAGWRGGPDFKAAIGGEALTRPLAEALLARSAGLWNLYGPTEASIFCIGCSVQSGAGLVPIGEPIANMRAYILDEQGQPVAPGSSGELYVSGAGVARGYHNRPELTAQKFLPDPFAGESGARMYRTGDLARRRDDGVIDYLGRTDNQVKIRGYRVELEEVEEVLAAQTAVALCAVIPRGEGDTKHLVAYYSLRKGVPLAGAALRPSLAEQLPEYMIPSQFIELPELPLTPNGKVDRGALSALPPPQPSLLGTRKRRGPSSKTLSRQLRENC